MNAKSEALHGTLPSTQVGSGMRISVGTYGNDCAATGDTKGIVAKKRRRAVVVVVVGRGCADRDLPGMNVEAMVNFCCVEQAR